MDDLSVSRFLASLRLMGLEFVVEDGRLVMVGAHADDLPPELLATLRARKGRLIEYLTPRSCIDCAEPCGSAARCSACAANRVDDRRGGSAGRRPEERRERRRSA